MVLNEKRLDEAGQAPLRVWLALFAGARRIETLMGRNLRGAFASSMAKFDLLGQLDRARNGLTMSELSERLLVTNGAVTGLIRRLVAEGLVERQTSKADKRYQRVRLTDQGRQVFAGMAPANQAWISQIMVGLSDGELVQLHRLLGKLAASAKEYDRRTAGKDGLETIPKTAAA